MRTITGSRRAVVGLGAVVGVLLASGTAAAKNVTSSAPRPGQELVVGAPEPDPVPVAVDGLTLDAPAPAPRVTSTTAPPASAGAATTVMPAPAPTTTTAAPRTTTTSAPPTTTRTPTPTTSPVAAAARSSLSPASGPPLTQVTIKGQGCLGGAAGIAIELQDPHGQGMSGDGGAALADGTWSIWIQIPANAGPGRYTVHPVCLRVNSSEVLATYAPLPFAVTA